MPHTGPMTTHAHISSVAVDCDGPFYRDYTVFMTDEEVNGEFGDIEFRNRILTSQVSVYSVSHGLRMTATEEGFEWYEDTDEGYRAGDVRWCNDEGCTESYSQRDIYAEMMGY